MTQSRFALLWGAPPRQLQETVLEYSLALPDTPPVIKDFILYSSAYGRGPCAVAAVTQYIYAETIATLMGAQCIELRPITSLLKGDRFRTLDGGTHLFHYTGAHGDCWTAAPVTCICASSIVEPLPLINEKPNA